MQQRLKVVFQVEKDGSTATVEAEAGELVTQAAYRAGVVIQQSCGGTPSCTDCRIKVLKSEGEAFSPIEGAEERLIGNVYFITKERLACQAKLLNSCEILVPTHQRREKILKKPMTTARVSNNQNQTTGGGKHHGHQEKSQKQKESFQEKGPQKKEGHKKKR